MEFFASASPGTEEALRDELCELGFDRVRLNRGGIPFFGDWEEGWRACMYSRIAQRVMVVMARFDALDQEALYRGVREIDWTRYVSVDTTISVSAVCRYSNISHSGFVALKTKDAIVDQIRDRFGDRPSVDRRDADVRFFVYLANDRARVYLDLSGEPLFKRGYRSESGDAPLKETVAAAILRMSGWDRHSQLLDPMCGSGTICIEAALWAGNVAPGIRRSRFGFERWACFDAADAETMQKIRGEARQAAHGQTPSITASDADSEMVRIARANARNAGVRIAFRVGRVQELCPDGPPRTVVSNPPYGMRLQADRVLYQQMCSAFSELRGWRISMLVPDSGADMPMAFPPDRSFDIKNGDLDCRFLVYDV